MASQKEHSRHRSPVLVAALTICSVIAVSHPTGKTAVAAGAEYYNRSYALVIGIDDYPARRWPDLNYARTDAQAMATFLKSQGFRVTTLLDGQATKSAIVAAMQSTLAREVTKQDRVLLFFAGHGYTEELADKDWGYIVPYHAADQPTADYISMEELQTLSRKMGKAKHQLFIMDACYGGLLTTRGVATVDPNVPNYLHDVTSRIARQILTAGGKDQEVLDQGPDNHSVFTGYLLEALQEAAADINRDGYITFSELTSYLVPRASNDYQTPAPGILPEHGLGEFVFRCARREPPPPLPPARPSVLVPRGADHPAPTRSAAVTSSEEYWNTLGRGSGALSVDPMRLRTRSRTLPIEDAKQMVMAHNFVHKSWNPNGTGIQHDYSRTSVGGDEIVVDRSTGATWQATPSETRLKYPDAVEYVRQLNATKFAGMSGWRLPTLEEAMSLVTAENHKQAGSLLDYYLDPIFDGWTRFPIWTSDHRDQAWTWVVRFEYGESDVFESRGPYYARVLAVATME